MTKKLYRLMNWPAIEEIIYSEASDPHALLGPHAEGNGTLIQMFAPGAKRAQVQFLKDMSETEMELVDEDSLRQMPLHASAHSRGFALCDGNRSFPHAFCFCARPHRSS